MSKFQGHWSIRRGCNGCRLTEQRRVPVKTGTRCPSERRAPVQPSKAEAALKKGPLHSLSRFHFWGGAHTPERASLQSQFYGHFIATDRKLFLMSFSKCTSDRFAPLQEPKSYAHCSTKWHWSATGYFLRVSQSRKRGPSFGTLVKWWHFWQRSPDIRCSSWNYLRIYYLIHLVALSCCWLTDQHFS